MSYITYRSSVQGNTRGEFPGYGFVRTLQNTTLISSENVSFLPHLYASTHTKTRVKHQPASRTLPCIICLPRSRRVLVSLLNAGSTRLALSYSYTYPNQTCPPHSLIFNAAPQSPDALRFLVFAISENRKATCSQCIAYVWYISTTKAGVVRCGSRMYQPRKIWNMKAFETSRHITGTRYGLIQYQYPRFMCDVSSINYIRDQAQFSISYTRTVRVLPIGGCILVSSPSIFI